jgi:hypothetical protein
MKRTLKLRTFKANNFRSATLSGLLKIIIGRTVCSAMYVAGTVSSATNVAGAVGGKNYQSGANAGNVVS